MPPRKEPQPAPVQIEVLKAWIDGGAPKPKVDRSILATLQVPTAKPATLRHKSGSKGTSLAVAIQVAGRDRLASPGCDNLYL